MLKEENLDISDFILKEDIGEGNFGKVKFCIYKKTGEEFAVKIINKKLIKDKMKNSFFKENEIATKFNHINVIYVFRIFEDKENFYLVMEYCQRGELFDYIVDHQRLSENEAAVFFYQLINGVEYIHSKGIAHRDLKPENLLLTNDKTLKIIDFGLSHEFDPSTSLLKTKCGSPSYAAPEIISCPFYDGFKTDIWCCGIILYAMLCGFLPFEGDDNSILFRNILECDPEMPDWLSISSRDLIIRILNPDPDERITLNEIKRHKFYLKGKKLCKINYEDINAYIKARKLKIDRSKDINDIFKLDKNIDENNNERTKKIDKNIKFKYLNTINGNNSTKAKPFNKNINMKNNNSINAFKKKLKNLKIKEKNVDIENINAKTPKVKKPSLEIQMNKSPNKNSNLGKEYNNTELNNIINPKNLSIKNGFSSLLSRLNSSRKPLLLKVMNTALDKKNINKESDNMNNTNNIYNNEANNEQRRCTTLFNKLKDDFKKFNHQKKLIISNKNNDNNYIQNTQPISSNRFISNININRGKNKILTLRDKINEILITDNNAINHNNHTNSRSVKNKRIQIRTKRNQTQNKKINLINNLYTKPIVYFDNLSININNINVHQKAYNNTLSAKSKNHYEKKISSKKNEYKDYNYKKRNNTINSKRTKLQINFDEFIPKGDFSNKYTNNKKHYDIKQKNQIVNIRSKKY